MVMVGEQGYAPNQVRMATASLPFGSLAAQAYETMYGAGQWYRQNVATPFSQMVHNDPGRTIGNHSNNIAADFATGLVRSPAILVETAGAAVAGSAFLARDPGSFVTRAGQGLGMQYEQIREGITERPAEFAGELAGTVLLTKGASKAAGAIAKPALSKIPTVEVKTVEIPTGDTTRAGAPVVNKYRVAIASRPGSPVTSGRVIGGVASTVKGTEETGRTIQPFRGHPGAIMEKTTIAMKTPLDVEKGQPWGRGEAVLMREHMARTASPEAADIIELGQVIQHEARTGGIRAAVDQQVQPFDLSLETFGGKGGAGNRAIVEVLSREKYRGRVITGGSISQKAYVPEGAYRDVSFSDVDLWVKDTATAKELFTDLTTELQKTGHVNLDPNAPFPTKLTNHGFEITGQRTDVRGIGAHLWEQFPQVQGQARLVKTAYGGEMEITNPVYNLESKIGGAFDSVMYKPGGKTELLINRAKDIPDIHSYTRQAAANVYDTKLTADVLGTRAARRERIAASYERMSEAAKKYGLNLEKTKQGSLPEKAKNLKPDEIGSGITVGGKVKKTLTREITRDVLKGNPREVRATVDILGPDRSGMPRGLGDEAVLFPRRNMRTSPARAATADIYPAGRSRGSRSRSSGSALAGTVRAQYPKGAAEYPAGREKAYPAPGKAYPAKTTTYLGRRGETTYKGGKYPAKKGGGNTYPRGGGGGDYPTGGGGNTEYTPITNTGDLPYMGPQPYPKGGGGGDYPPPPTEIPRERTRTRITVLTTPTITARRRKEEEDLLIWQGEKVRKTAPYLEEAPVASHLEMMKGITNAKRHRKNTDIL